MSALCRSVKVNSRSFEGDYKDDMSQGGDSSSGGVSGGGLEPIWLGVGSPRPQPRVLQNAMFGHVVDAFDEKSIFKIGQQPQDRQRTSQQTHPAAPDSGQTTATTANAAATGSTSYCVCVSVTVT